MSASNQKKLRKEKAEAYMSERQRIEAKEQKKLKIYTATFWIVLALCVCIVLGTVLSNPIKNVVYTNTNAITVGNHTLNAVELNYFYIDAINNYVNKYSSMISYILDVNSPLNEQVADKTTNATWADTFLDMALENIKSTYALYDLANEKGHELTEDEAKSVDTMFSNLEIYATYYGYSNVDAYLRAVYGNGASAESYRAYYEISALADSYYYAYSDSLEYSDSDLRTYEADKLYQYNSYTYAYYQLNAAKFYEGGTKDDNGNITYTTEEKKAAAEKAEKVVNAMISGDFEVLKQYLTLPEKEEDLQKLKDAAALKTVEDLNTIIKALAVNEGLTTAEATVKEDDLYSSVTSLFRDWIIGKVETESNSTSSDSEDEKEEQKPTYVDRTPGEVKVFPITSGTGDNELVTGYYVVRFDSLDKNTFFLKNVRHILVSFEGGTYNSTTDETTYTDAEKNTAKTEAMALLAQWQKGEKTEESFSALATEKTDDSGSKENGGLYEDIYPHQNFVQSFKDWCYEEGRKAGDTGVIESDYGYHIMYFVGDSETTYRDYMVTGDIREEDVNEWHEALVDAIVLKELNMSYVEMDMILNG